VDARDESEVVGILLIQSYRARAKEGPLSPPRLAWAQGPTTRDRWSHQWPIITAAALLDCERI